jgi:hypothetical protein
LLHSYARRAGARAASRGRMVTGRRLCRGVSWTRTGQPSAVCVSCDGWPRRVPRLEEVAASGQPADADPGEQAAAAETNRKSIKGRVGLHTPHVPAMASDR